MTVQTTFTYDAARFLPGELVDAGMTDKVSRVAAAVANFGALVTRRGSPADTPEQAAPPEATADVTARPVGIALRNQLSKQAAGYAVNDMVDVLTRGRVAVTCETAWTDKAQVFFRFATPGASFLGAARNDADTANAVALPGTRFVGSGSGPGVAVIEINLP